MNSTAIDKLRTLSDLIPLGGFIEAATKNEMKTIWRYEMNSIIKEEAGIGMVPKSISDYGIKAAYKAIDKLTGKENEDIVLAVNQKVMKAIAADIEKYKKEKSASFV